MRELEDRFRSLDRIEPPDLWNESVARAAELGMARRQPFSRAWLLIAAALLLVILAAAIAIGARLIWPAPNLSTTQYANGMIVAQHGCGRLIGIDPSSGEERELVASPPACAGDYMAVATAWSADGQRLAYGLWRECGGCVDQSEPAGAFLYEVATGASRQIGECSELSCKEIDISPDGSLVTFYAESLTDGRNTLAVVEVDSGVTRRVALPGASGSPRFSPDGTQIVLPMLGGTSGLYVVDTDSDELKPTYLYGMVDASNPAWAPNGEWIAFDQVSGDGTTGIWVVRADGTEPRLLASDPASEGPGFPTWSPDSRSVAYVWTGSDGASAAARFQLWTVDLDGGEPSLVYESDCCIDDWKGPDWSPDGRYIAFGVHVEERAAASGTAFIRPDGSDLRWISAYPLAPNWQPIPLPTE